MTAQMIRPQTRTPTASAAIQAPCQRLRMWVARSLAGTGMPPRFQVSMSAEEQPAARTDRTPVNDATQALRSTRRGTRSPAFDLTGCFLPLDRSAGQGYAGALRRTHRRISDRTLLGRPAPPVKDPGRGAAP